MSYRTTLHYTPDLVRYAVSRFWWRVLGWRFVLAALLLALALAVLLLGGDRSCWVGALATGLVVIVLFAVALYAVHYRNSMAKLRAMERPEAQLEANAQTLNIRSGVASVALPWSSVSEIWRFQHCWLLLFSKAAFSSLPVADLPDELQAFLLEHVRAAGGKVH